MLGFIKRLFGPGIDFRKLIEAGAVIVDVRSQGEYRSEHIPGSKNIPLEQVKSKVAELKKSGKPVITVCRSGARSGMAKSVLAAAGVEVYNGGPWNSLQRKIQ